MAEFDLFGNQKEVVLLALLDEYILIVEEQALSCRLVDFGHFLLVDGEAALLCELAKLAFAGEHGSLFGEQVNDFDRAVEVGLCNLKCGHAFKYGKECVLVDAAQDVAGLVAEENLRCLDSSFVVGSRVYHSGDLLGEAFLQRTLSGILGLFGNKLVDLFAGKLGEDLDIFLGIGIRYVQPELVELVGRSLSGIEPYVAALGFSEFSTIGFCDKRACQRESLTAVGAANKLGTGCDVAPLV